MTLMMINWVSTAYRISDFQTTTLKIFKQNGEKTTWWKALKIWAKNNTPSKIMTNSKHSDETSTVNHPPCQRSVLVLESRPKWWEKFSRWLNKLIRFSKGFWKLRDSARRNTGGYPSWIGLPSRSFRTKG